MVAETLTVKPDCWIISVMAGISMEHLSKLYESQQIIRCMPNTPATVMEAMSVWSSKIACPPETKKKVKHLFELMGDELYVKDESYIDMATAISGSGPAVSTVCMSYINECFIVYAAVSMCFLQLKLSSMRQCIWGFLEILLPASPLAPFG